ncbi:tyrosinase precursor [Fusarium pseudocircinatum]|uniref:tyrosinase n=1 Tax=Fusarium pseudocircinatum TaxID=56676 RepID=A0A8H5LAV3_9HYPO|nr:tyrosinase precursor [Fusarium pseudocircinatum]
MVLALNRFKEVKVDKRLSYFQVAGIHAYPLQPWDGAAPPNKDPEDPKKLPPGANPFGGYCEHNTITFATWHRPYMLLFEQLVWTHMKDQIKDWQKDRKLDPSEAAEWEKTANEWRLPYWDWAGKKYSKKHGQEYALPEIFRFELITTYPPDNTRGETGVTNPFYEFENPMKDDEGNARAFGNMPASMTQWNIPDHVEKGDPGEPDVRLPWSKCSATSRYGLRSEDGVTWTGLAGFNNFDEANKTLSKFQEGWYAPYLEGDKRRDTFEGPGTLGDAVNRLFSPKYTDTWETFSSTKWWNESAREMSTGYLSLEYIHNHVHYVEDKKKDDPLLPFHRVKTNHPATGYWTSDDARDWTKLNYQYDDLIPKPGAIDPEKGVLKEDQFKSDLKKRIEDLYPSPWKYSREVFESKTKKDQIKFFGPDNAENQTWNDYLINVVYDRYALNGSSYSIQFWLGGNADDPDTTFRDEENLIGQVYSFAGMSPSTETCSNCASQKDKKVLSRAQVLLTIPIISQALDSGFKHIKTTTPEEVETYLKGHLRWKFVQIGGLERPAEDFPNTTISVFGGVGKPRTAPDDAEKGIPPIYADYQILYEATQKKPCGLSSKDHVLGASQKLNFRTFSD